MERNTIYALIAAGGIITLAALVVNNWGAFTQPIQPFFGGNPADRSFNNASKEAW